MTHLWYHGRLISDLLFACFAHSSTLKCKYEDFLWVLVIEITNIVKNNFYSFQTNLASPRKNMSKSIEWPMKWSAYHVLWIKLVSILSLIWNIYWIIILTYFIDSFINQFTEFLHWKHYMIIQKVSSINTAWSIFM